MVLPGTEYVSMWFVHSSTKMRNCWPTETNALSRLSWKWQYSESPKPLIKAVDINQYVIATAGETLAIRCPGLLETHQTTGRGTYNLTCTRPCSITGTGWSFKCIDRLYLAKRFVFPAVRVTAIFNFITLLKYDEIWRAGLVSSIDFDSISHQCQP